MIAYKKQIPLDIHWNIWNQKWNIIFDSNLIFKKLVGQEELESSTFAVSERHSNQLNYWPNFILISEH